MKFRYAVTNQFIEPRLTFNPENVGYPVTFNAETETKLALHRGRCILCQYRTDTQHGFRRLCLYVAGKAWLLYLAR